MGTSVGVGLSKNRNTRAAAREAAEQALAAAGVREPDFVLVFMTVGHDPRLLLPEIRAVTGGAPLTGTSVAGCITAGAADESAYCVEVTVIRSDELRVHNVAVADMASDPRAAGRALGEALRPRCEDDAVALLLFGDAYTLNYTALAAGLEDGLELDRFLPVLGGGSSNDIHSQRTYQLHDDDVHEQGAVCALISGPNAVLSTVTHGCYPLGLRQTVTRSKDNWIYELDGKPALDVISSFITEEESRNWLIAVANLCLGLELPEELASEYDPLCIRYMVGRELESSGLMIQAEVPEGTSIWLARREPEKICAAADRAAASLRERLGDRAPKLMMQLECVGRGRFLLNEPTKLDLIRRTQRAAPAGVPWTGAYISGEIAPVGETNMFHNYTSVVLAVL
ncbi:MAG: FIST C-terminal domain-containing protein [Myxococcales bacterium]|nr:FIST C-terminal domain-containing protein [Myxococcales bacterium]